MIHRIPLLAAAVLSMGFQQAGPPAEPLRTISSEVVITPDWELAPRLAYPALAASHDIESGRVVLRCNLTDRRLKHCEPVSEEPKGEGFGEAAVAGISLGVITEDWASKHETGSAVFLPVYFRLY